MNIKVNFDNIKVKETKKDFTVKILMLKGEKGEQGDLNPSHIVDNLTSNDSSKVLSAKQGKVLKDLVDVNTTKITKKPYYFNTVADMKAYNLSAGDMAITKGYYSSNDGGGAEYNIVASTSNYSETLNNNLKAELIIKDTINVKQFGAKSNDNSFNNTEIIQYCLNNYKNIYIPDGYFYTNSLFMKTSTNLFGNGKNSVLIPLNSSENGLINITNENVKTNIKDLRLYGNNIEIDAIKITREQQTAIDSNEIFENIYIDLFNGKGINLASDYIRSSFIVGCNISNCESDGLYLSGTDNFIDNCLSYWNKGNGIYIKDGSSNKINNSKCFGNSENGLYVNGSANQISNVECQDNYKCGIYNYQSWGNGYNNIIASTNGLKENNGSDYSNINFTNSYDCYINGHIFNRRTASSNNNHSKYGCEINNSTNLKIDLKQHNLNIGLLPFKYENLNVSNKININNVDYSLKNIYENELIGVVGTTANLSHLFTSSNIRANSDGSISCSKVEQAQNIEIGNNTTTDNSSRVSVYGEIELANENGENISLYVAGSNNKLSTEAQIFGSISFLNSSGGTISQTNDVYGVSSFLINSVIPDNTAKIKYTITYSPLVQNLQGKFSITDVKASIY